MNHSETRILILLGAIVGMVAAHAQKSPDQPNSSSPSPAVTAPVTPPSPSAAVLRQAKLAGYHIKKLRDGKTMFCKNETHLGSRFSTESCLDESQLAEFLIRTQTQRDNLNNRLGSGTDKH